MHRTCAGNGNRPGRSTLDALPARVLTFLMAIATRAPIRALMREAGFGANDHAEGWRLLMAAGEFRERAAVDAQILRANAAIGELHAWVTVHFRRFRAALARLHPEWLELFPELDLRYPADSLLAVAALVEALRHGDAGRDPQLLATMQKRGLKPTELERLAKLVSEAQHGALVTAGQDANSDDRTKELVQLYHYYRDWMESAKSVIKRKDYRAQLGIGCHRE